MRRNRLQLAIAIAALAPALIALAPAQDPAPGTVAGVIRYVGKVPDPVIVIQGMDEQPVLHVADSGALRYAVVYLTPLEATAPPPAMSGEQLEPAVLDQLNFIFRPQVLAVRPGQLVRFTNQDSAHHTVMSFDPNPANAFNVSTDGILPPEHRFALNDDYRPVTLGCDIHPWMVAWVYVFDHARFAVTDADGRFEIEAPPGRYLLSVRQPSGGLERDIEVGVSSGETKSIDVDFTEADLKLPPAAAYY